MLENRKENFISIPFFLLSLTWWRVCQSYCYLYSSPQRSEVLFKDGFIGNCNETLRHLLPLKRNLTPCWGQIYHTLLWLLKYVSHQTVWVASVEKDRKLLSLVKFVWSFFVCYSDFVFYSDTFTTAEWELKQASVNVMLQQSSRYLSFFSFFFPSFLL